jgi:phage FluMu protein Com
MQSRLQSPQSKTRAPTDRASSLRCGCGNLLARVVADGVEIKCRRCKRYVVVPLEAKETMRINM